MKPASVLLTLPLALLGFVVAEAQAPADADDVAQFQRDLPLIEALVAEGVQIAAEEDALNRAQACNRLADHFARAMHEAAMRNSLARATTLGNGVEKLLLRGVAHNLSLAGAILPKDSPRRAELERLGQDVAQAAKRFDSDMARIAEFKTMHHALEAINKARAEVQDVIKGKSTFFDKSRKSKKGKSAV